MNDERTVMHIAESLSDIEDQLTHTPRLWAEFVTPEGDRAKPNLAFIVDCGNDPDDEPDGDSILVGWTRVYLSPVIAARIVAALVGEAIDTGAE